MAKRIIRFIVLGIALYLINKYLLTMQKHQLSALKKPVKSEEPKEADRSNYGKQEIKGQIEQPTTAVPDPAIRPMGPVAEEKQTKKEPEKRISYSVVSPHGKDTVKVHERFVRSWIIKNTGTEPLKGLVLICIDNDLDGIILPLNDVFQLPVIMPGGSYIATVPFDANKEGTCISRWVMIDQNGNYFPSDSKESILEDATVLPEEKEKDETEENDTPADDMSQVPLPDPSDPPHIDDYTQKLRDAEDESAVQHSREETAMTDEEQGTGTFLFNIDDPTVINTLISAIMHSPDYPYRDMDAVFTNDVFLAFKKSRKQIAFIVKVHVKDTRSYNYIIYDVLTGKLAQNDKLPSLVTLTTTKVNMTEEQKKDAEKEINKYVKDYISGSMSKQEKKEYIQYLQKIADAKVSGGMFNVYRYFERKW